MKAEKTIRVVPGWPVLLLVILLFGAGIAGAIQMARLGEEGFLWELLVADIAAFLLAALICPGLFVVEPNGSRVLLLFGNYRGTVKEAGFHWTNPLMSKRSAKKLFLYWQIPCFLRDFVV